MFKINLPLSLTTKLRRCTNTLLRSCLELFWTAELLINRGAWFSLLYSHHDTWHLSDEKVIHLMLACIMPFPA